MHEVENKSYIPDLKSKVVYTNDGPKPQFLIDTPGFKTLVVGLEEGQQIPIHPGEAAMYHFLEGTGQMIVDEVSYVIKPGVTIIAPAGAKRGMKAETRIIFLGAKGG